LLRLFGKESVDETMEVDAGVSTLEGEDRAPEETEALLRSAGVVEECDDDLCLTGEFEDVRWRRIRRFRADDERAATQLAAVIDVDPDALEFVEDDDRFGVTFEGDRIAQWASDAAFYADLATEPTLSEWLPDWDGLSDRQRTELLAGMRAFLEECPACDADLAQVEDVRKSCCSGEMVNVSVDCPDCGALVFSGSYQ